MDIIELNEKFKEPNVINKDLRKLEELYSYKGTKLCDLQGISSGSIKIGGLEYQVSKSVLNSIDNQTGFPAIWKEYEKQSSSEYPFNKSQVRDYWYSEKNINIKLLTYHYPDRSPVIVGATSQGKNLILPTKLVSWMSLFCHKHGIVGEFEDHHITEGIDLFLRPTESLFDIAENDEMQLKVNLRWDNHRKNSIVTSSYLERLICLNGTYTQDHALSHEISSIRSDVGSIRKSIERSIAQQFINISELKDKVIEIYNTEKSNLIGFSETWLKRRQVPAIITNNIIEELRESKHETLGDFFNAITFARHRVHEQNIELPDGEDIDRYLGYLAGKLIGNLNRKDVNLDFLRKHV
jgi:hypothetical protein